MQIFVLSISLLISACSDKAASENSSDIIRYVKTQQVKSAGDSVFRELPGVVAANQEAQLSFRIAGKIEQLLVKQGDQVSEGQLLAKLDETDIKIKLKSDKAVYERALSDFNRGKALIGQGTISQSQYSQLESDLASAEANYESTKQNLAYSSLTAPFSGTIARREIDNFEEVQAKQTVFILQDVSSIDVKIDLPESIMILVTEDKKPDVVAIFDAIPDRTFPVTFKEIATQADSETNTYEVTMSMPRVDGFNILPGMSVTARAKQKIGQGNQLTSTIFIPAHAVLEDNSSRYVFIAQPQQNGLATVEKRTVVTGKLSSAGLEIVTGLNDSEHLIVAGMSKMFDGLQVRMQSE